MVTSLFTLLIILVHVCFFVAGVWMIVRGVRGPITASEPHCRRCKYDLRQVLIAGSPNCPECGADLGERRAVAFGRARRRPVLALAGAGVILFPIVASLVVSVVTTRFNAPPPVFAGGPGNFAAMSGAQLAAAAANAGQASNGPWLWQEIERRKQLGTLSADELAAVADAVATGIGDGTVNRGRIMPWAGNLLRSLLFDETVSEKSRTALAEALAPQIEVAVSPRVKVGALRTLRVDVERVDHNSQNDVLVAVHGIRLVGDGVDRPLEPAGRRWDRAPNPPVRFLGSDSFASSFDLPTDVPAGSYEVRADVEMAALFEKPPLLDDERRPRHPDRWSKSRIRRRATITAPVTIVGAGEQVVSFLPPDESAAAAAAFRDAWGHVGLKIRTDRNGRLRLSLLEPSRRSRRTGDAYCFQVVAIFGDVAIPLKLEAGHRGGTSSRGGGTISLDGVPLDVTTAVVELRPAPDEADQMLSVGENGELPPIIGETIRFEDVPVERDDG